MRRAAARAASSSRARRFPRIAQPPARRDAPSSRSSCRVTISTSRRPLSGERRSALLWDTHWGGDFDLVDYVDGRCHVPRRLPGDARRSSSGRSIRTRQLLPARGLGVGTGVGDERVRRSCSITCRGISAIGPSVIRSLMNVAGGPACCAHSTRAQHDDRRHGRRRPVVARAYVDYTWTGRRRRHACAIRLSRESALYGRARRDLTASTKTIAGRERRSPAAASKPACASRAPAARGAVCRLRARDRRRSRSTVMPGSGRLPGFGWSNVIAPLEDNRP